MSGSQHVPAPIYGRVFRIPGSPTWMKQAQTNTGSHCQARLRGGGTPLSWSASMPWTGLGMVVVLGCAGLCWSAEPLSPYIGQEQQEITALSAEEVQGYLSGSGMGLAKAAELHHYPGPRHVLDLAEPLQLSAEQRQKTQSIFEEMRTEA